MTLPVVIYHPLPARKVRLNIFKSRGFVLTKRFSRMHLPQPLPPQLGGRWTGHGDIQFRVAKQAAGVDISRAQSEEQVVHQQQLAVHIDGFVFRRTLLRAESFGDLLLRKRGQIYLYPFKP